MYVLMYNKGFMNTFKYALESRGLTVIEASKRGLPYSTVRKHWLGERELGVKSVLRYEKVLGIPRSELMPEFWPPAVPNTATERGEGNG